MMTEHLPGHPRQAKCKFAKRSHNASLDKAMAADGLRFILRSTVVPHSSGGANNRAKTGMHLDAVGQRLETEHPDRHDGAKRHHAADGPANGIGRMVIAVATHDLKSVRRASPVVHERLLIFSHYNQETAAQFHMLPDYN
jgi:hypothetical protein